MLSPAARDRYKHRDLKPCIAELLRTCVRPPSITLKVEHAFLNAVDTKREQVSNDDEDDLSVHGDDSINNESREEELPRYLRLILSDGKLQIQAVLAPNLHTKELLELRPGDLVEIKKFQVRTAARVNGQGRVVYLGVQACEWIGTAHFVDEDLGGGFIPEGIAEDEPTATESRERLTPSTIFKTTELEGGFFRERSETELTEDDNTPNSKRTQYSPTPSMSRKRGRMPQHRKISPSKRRHVEQQSRLDITTHRPSVQFSTPPSDSSDSDDDAFETIFVSQSTIQRRRETLRNVHVNGGSTRTTPKRFQVFDGKGDVEDALKSAPPSPEKTLTGQNKEPLSSKPLSHDTTGNSAPPKSTLSQPPLRLLSTIPLQSLNTLLTSPDLPRRNYTCSILAVITWISPSLIHKPHSPFPPKRHIKIHDPSISSRYVGVSLAVYVDARRFLPSVGTVALFRGVTMQRWEGEVILNAYAGLKDSPEEWCLTDESVLVQMGHDVQEMRRWWAERKGRKISGVGIKEA